MKLLCIKSGLLNCPNNLCDGHLPFDLKEGEIYETLGEIYIDYDAGCNTKVYYIKGLGPKLACRFVKALDQSETQAISYSKEDLNKAIEEENYELADIIHKELSP